MNFTQLYGLIQNSEIDLALDYVFDKVDSLLLADEYQKVGSILEKI